MESLRQDAGGSRRLGVKTIWQVVKHDLFGTKDVEDSPTLSYTWLADEFGHFALGFMGSLGGAQLLCLGLPYWPLETRVVIAAFLAVALIAFKEWRDFCTERRQSAQRTRDRPEPFAFNAGEVISNCVCVCVFVILGAAVAVSGVYTPLTGLIAFLTSLVLICGVAYWWLKRKVAFQQADLPYLYRLAKFPSNFIDVHYKKVVHRLICKPDEKQHVLIFGPIGAGKTSLAVGIGTEAAFRLQIARFTSMIDLSQWSSATRPSQSRTGWWPDTEFKDGRVLWPLNSVDLLIIDDLDGGVAGGDPIDPKDILAALKQAPGLCFFKERHRTVWIAGSRDNVDVGCWHKVVADLVAGGETAAVCVIKLATDLPHRPIRDPNGLGHGIRPKDLTGIAMTV